jgi:hypothetical protein
MDAPRLELKDWIAAVKRELIEAEATDAPKVLRLKQVKLEAALTTEASAEAKAGVKLWVVANVGVRASTTESGSQRVTLVFEPSVELTLGPNDGRAELLK